MGSVPFLPRLFPPSPALVRANALELAILAGHVLLYPTGLSQERRSCALASPPQAKEQEQEQRTDPPRTEKEHGPPPRLPGNDEDRPPVLLLHGFIDNRSVFVLLRRSLRRHGWQHVEALNYSPLSCDIRASAALLGEYIEEVCARTGHHRVDVVGHSLGGLIARYYVQRLGGDSRVRTLAMLGTPHSGTRALPLMTLHPIVRQMRPDSDVIEDLARPAPNCTTHFVSFWSDLDQFMIPLETASLHHPDLHTRNVRVSGVGHLALPVHGTVAAGIREALAAEISGTGVAPTISVA